MSKKQHTPGPWEINWTVIHGKRYGFSGVRTINPDNLIELPGSGGAMSLTRTVCEQPHGSCAPVHEANMTLIAHAPDLLAQLKEADQLLARCSSRVDPEHDKDLWQDMVVNAEITRQLIERIEGPSPPITEDDLTF